MKRNLISDVKSIVMEELTWLLYFAKRIESWIRSFLNVDCFNFHDFFRFRNKKGKLDPGWACLFESYFS